MKITEALLAEHLVFQNLFDHLEAAAPRLKALGEIKALSALMQSMLKAHSRTEEELFLGPLAPSFEQIGQHETFHQEHDLIEKNLERVQKATEARKACELLLATIDLCRRHIDKEERIVFPMAERTLKSNTLLELGTTWMNQRIKVAA
jgi:hemerythrin-like domain-containing protein